MLRTNIPRGICGGCKVVARYSRDSDNRELHLFGKNSSAVDRVDREDALSTSRPSLADVHFFIERSSLPRNRALISKTRCREIIQSKSDQETSDEKYWFLTS